MVKLTFLHRVKAMKRSHKNTNYANVMLGMNCWRIIGRLWQLPNRPMAAFNMADRAMSHRKDGDDFGAPVFVAIGASGQTVAVTSSLQALGRLLHGWPARDGAMYQHARHACVLAIQGSIDSKVARKAFERAAREAGILVEGK